jgi:DNA primase
MHFPKDFSDKLRSTILVSEVVGKKVKLKLRGKEFQGLCPFHNEKSPSFTVNDQKGFFHCFGCQAHGDVISFVMQNEGMEYPEAIEKLANDFSIPIPQVQVNYVQENQIDQDYLILEKINVFFETKLVSEIGRQALSYLQKRGISKAIIKKFRLGFAPNSYDELINFLKSEGFGESQIIASGIIGKNEKNQLYSKFRNRVIFPILDKKNRVIAFGGRCLGDELPKYLNSAETNFFKKSQTLYNYSYARKAIFDKSYAVVLEGYMDVISLFANGLENIVAGLGTALGEDHLKELFYITDKIIICLDGDSAGIRAAKRVSEIALPLISAKKNISFVFLPNKMDPDDFVKEFGARKLEELFDQAIPLSESLFEFALIELGIDKNKKITAENKAKIEGNLYKKIDVIKDNSSKKYFAQFFKDLLFKLGRGDKKAMDLRVFDKNFLTKATHNFSDSMAKNIIALMIKHPELAAFRDDHFDIREIEFLNEDLTHLKELVIELSDENEKKILARLENTGSNSYIDDIKNILISLEDSDSSANISRFRILLLKDLLLQVNAQYKDSLSKIDEIQTHQSAITNQKIKEIFDYKISLEQEILLLEKELI